MTRLASILGVATVATLVLLSGCESPTKTDYAKDLQGTWKATLDVPHAGPPPTTVMTPVEATVERTDTNKGTVKLTVTNPTGALSVMGSIEVTATEIKVSDIMVDPPTAVTLLPEGAAAVLAQPQTLTYELSGDGSNLEVSNTTLFPVLLGPSNTELTLTKQTASTSSR